MRRRLNKEQLSQTDSSNFDSYLLSTMFLRQIFKTNRKFEADHSSLGNDRIPYTSNVTTGPSYTNLSHTLSGRDTVMQPESSLTDTLRVSEADTTQNYSKRSLSSPLNSHLCEFR